MNRKLLRQKQRRSKKFKLLAGILLFIIFTGSFIHVSSAEQDITSIISSWFERKTADSVEIIEEVITGEQEKQTNRLKEELKSEIDLADKSLDEFTVEESKMRQSELEQYANELIQNFKVDNDVNEQERLEELENILAEAKNKMNAVGKVSPAEASEEVPDES